VVRHPRDPTRVRVTLEDGTFWDVDETTVAAFDLRPERCLEATELAHLEAAAWVAWAWRRALAWLQQRPYSEAELRRRLRRHGVPDTAVAATLERLRSLGLLDDRAFAELLVRSRRRGRPRGRRALEAELRARGIDETTARAALAAEGGDELDAARRAAARWRPRAHEDRTRARRRLAQYLARRGFDAGIIQAVVAERLRESTPTDCDGPAPM